MDAFTTILSYFAASEEQPRADAPVEADTGDNSNGAATAAAALLLERARFPSLATGVNLHSSFSMPVMELLISYAVVMPVSRLEPGPRTSPQTDVCHLDALLNSRTDLTGRA
ncbi:unnamed protein product [Peniophora sp. CBMAI 1063]|nr:unnamed protein product [Peniophora sp. CBMAI 1063]